MVSDVAADGGSSRYGLSFDDASGASPGFTIRRGKRLTLAAVKDGLKGVKAGSEVTVTTEKKEGEEVVTKIVVLVPEKK